MWESDAARVVQTVLRPDGEAASRWEVFSRAEGETSSDAWRRHAEGRLVRGDAPPPSAVDLTDLQARLPDEVPLEGFYERLAAQGLQYGPGFRGLKRLWRDGDEVLGAVELPEPLRREAAAYCLHPAWWDACLHVLGGGEVAAEGEGLYVPVRVAAVDVWRRATGTVLYSHARRQVDGDGVTADVTLYDAAGTPLARLAGLRLQRVSREAFVAVQHVAQAVAAGETARTVSFDTVALKRLSSDEQRDRIVAFLRQQAAAVLRIGSPNEIDAKKSFFEMGMDSLMGVEFLYRINRHMQTNLSAQRLMEKPHLGRLADVLLAQLRDTPETAATMPAAGDMAAGDGHDEPASVWFPDRRIRPAVRVRLLCFAGADGDASVFADWPDKFPAEVEVCAVELPGVGRRRDEVPIDDLGALVDTVSESLLDYLDRPFALVGHREGSVLAFELAHRLQDRFGLCPVHLFVGAAPAPDAWEAEYRSLSGFASVSASRIDTATTEHTALATAVAEDDASPAAGYLRDYHFQPRAPLDCAITAMASRHDGAEMREALCAWQRHATGSLRVELLPGSTDDYLENVDRVARIIAADLLRALDD